MQQLRLAAMLAAVVSLCACSASPSAPAAVSLADDGGASPSLGSPPAVLVGSGDIGLCGSVGHELTASLLDRIAGTVFAAGDVAYPHGRTDDFRNCYDPSWGRHRDRTRPAPGNHEYDTGTAAAYFEYFGPNAGPPGRGYYSYTLGAWHVLSLNSEVDVRARSRGGPGSRNPVKLHLRVDFNRYARGQTFLGLKSIILKNLVQQPSMIAEQVTMALFERMGQPAPRESFCRLYVNNVYQGVFSIVESVDEDFLARTVGESDGYLFSYQFGPEIPPFWGADLGDDYEPYRVLFEAETHTLASDADLYGPIRELFRQVNAPFDSVWRERVEEYLDLPQFVTHVAIETFLAEEDGLLRPDGMNNFFLYRGSDATRHRLFVWDKDRTFSLIGRPILLYADENEILRRALAFEDLRRLFLDVLEQCARVADENDWLLNTIEHLTAVVADATREDPLKPHSNEEFDAATDFLRQFARERPGFVLREVANAR